MAADFVCNVTSVPADFLHFWEHTIGSGHATLALRADWQKQLLRCHNELGFKHVRFHGILSDDMGTMLCEQDKIVYSFFNADQVYDYIISIGMHPFVELSFMPSTLSSGSETVFFYRGNVTPPKDYSAWETFITTIVQHWMDRYGIEELRNWFFEVWNEPNLSAFWTGKQEEYFKLYNHTVKPIKAINNELKVGGPATAKNEWIIPFSNYCKENNLPYDFLSTHQYPTDAFGKPGDDTETQLSKSKRSVMRDEVIEIKKQAGEKPVYYTEWCTSSNPFDDLHDLPYASAFIIKTIIEARGNVKGYSYWTFSDIFEENYFSSVPFHGGFGLLNIYGIPKPAYRAYELLHRLGEEMFSVEGTNPTVDVWITRNVSIINILITNSALPRHAVKTEKITIQLNNIVKIKNALIEKIDDTHANATAKWNEMGSPKTLSLEQVATLELASSLIKEKILYNFQNNIATIDVQIPAQGTALITIETE